MAAFLSNLDLVFGFLYDVMTRIYAVYTANPPLVAVLALWVLDRIFGIFKLIKG